MARTITAEYDRDGYDVLLNGEPIYTAGNAHGDSQAWVPPEQGVSLRQLRSFAISTGRELAEERGAQWGGASLRDKDE